MKKLISLAMLIAMVCAIAPVQTYGQVEKSDIKAAKSQAKDLKKKGWEAEGGTTIENGLIKIAKKEAAGYTLLTGTSYGSQKANVGKTKARNNAINEFAEYGKSIVKARINTKVDDIDGEEVDNIVTGYERMVVRELDEILPMPSLVLRRDKNGSYDYQCYYMINEQALRKAQKKAVEEAIEQSGLAAKYGNSISDFINSGFNEK